MKSGTPPPNPHPLTPATLISWVWAKVCSWLLTLKNENGEITEANDATCAWMPHYHAFAFIPTWKSPAFLLHQSCLTLVFSAHDSSLRFPHCPCLISGRRKKKSTFRRVRGSDRGGGRLASGAAAAAARWNVNWLSWWRDEGTSGGRQERPSSIVSVFLKTWLLSDDYSNPGEDLPASTGGLIAPPQSFFH